MTLQRRPRQRRDAGFTLIDMLFVIALIGLLSSLAIPGVLRARGVAQASSALASLRVVSSGQLSFAITCGLGFYATDLPTLGRPPLGSTEAYLGPDLTSGAVVIKSGYTISMAGTPAVGSPPTCNGLAAGMTSPAYAAVADPLDPAVTVPRFFGTNSDGVIYEHDSTLSAVMPETGPPPMGQALK